MVLPVFHDKRASVERQIELLRAKFRPFNDSEMLSREAELREARKSKERNNALIHVSKNTVK